LYSWALVSEVKQRRINAARKLSRYFFIISRFELKVGKPGMKKYEYGQI
jgi:hypothetical protein